MDRLIRNENNLRYLIFKILSPFFLFLFLSHKFYYVIREYTFILSVQIEFNLSFIFVSYWIERLGSSRQHQIRSEVCASLNCVI